LKKSGAAWRLKANDRLPLGLAHKVKLLKSVAEGEMVKRSDVECNESDTTVQFRREMEKTFAADLAAPVASSF